MTPTIIQGFYCITSHFVSMYVYQSKSNGQTVGVGVSHISMMYCCTFALYVSVYTC